MKQTKPTKWLTLYDGSDLSKWAINKRDLKIKGDALVFSGKSVRAEIGGMSWDNYVLSTDVMIIPTSKNPKCCVQLTASGTGVYCQLVSQQGRWCIVIAYYCDKPKKKPKGFTHLITPPLVTPRNRRWFTFQMKAEHGRLTAIVDGKKIVSANIPSGTAGMPGFLIHHYKRQTGCIVRLRNIKIKFLKPTQKQLQEFKRDAMTNWRKYEESLKRT